MTTNGALLLQDHAIEDLRYNLLGFRIKTKDRSRRSHPQASQSGTRQAAVSDSIRHRIAFFVASAMLDEPK
jgi:hypothetical protein